jgi:hypothetical protein
VLLERGQIANQDIGARRVIVKGKAEVLTNSYYVLMVAFFCFVVERIEHSITHN